MEFKSQADRIHKFLTRYQDIWQAEVLDGYPESISLYPQEWIDSLWNLPINDLHRFDSKLEVSQLHGTSLETFIKEAQTLTKIESVQNFQINELEDWAWTDVKLKKKHEIESLAPILKNLESTIPFNKIIDIGGGVGHFSRILAHYYQIDCISIDSEKSFQDSGKKRMNRYRKIPGAKSVQFENIYLGPNIQDEEKLRNILTKKSFTVGLHTCGALSNTVINSTLKFSGAGLLNFGCCYHKMEYLKDFPISEYYKRHFDLKMNIYAFTLATRAHGTISFDDFKLKWRVKNYRGALHLFLFHRLGIKNCFNVGELKNVKEYNLPFSHYIRSKLLHLKIEHLYSDEDFESFFNDQSTQETLRKMFLTSMIRWHIGRVLELFILLDRAIYLNEKNYQVSFKTYFDENISPRNIGILAIKN